MVEHTCIFSIDDCRCKVCGKLFCHDNWCPIECPNPSERSEEDQLKRFEEEMKDENN